MLATGQLGGFLDPSSPPALPVGCICMRNQEKQAEDPPLSLKYLLHGQREMIQLHVTQVSVQLPPPQRTFPGHLVLPHPPANPYPPVVCDCPITLSHSIRVFSYHPDPDGVTH